MYRSGWLKSRLEIKGFYSHYIELTQVEAKFVDFSLLVIAEVSPWRDMGVKSSFADRSGDFSIRSSFAKYVDLDPSIKSSYRVRKDSIVDMGFTSSVKEASYMDYAVMSVVLALGSVDHKLKSKIRKAVRKGVRLKSFYSKASFTSFSLSSGIRHGYNVPILSFSVSSLFIMRKAHRAGVNKDLTATTFTFAEINIRATLTSSATYDIGELSVEVSSMIAGGMYPLVALSTTSLLDLSSAYSAIRLDRIPTVQDVASSSYGFANFKYDRNSMTSFLSNPIEISITRDTYDQIPAELDDFGMPIYFKQFQLQHNNFISPIGTDFKKLNRWVSDSRFYGVFCPFEPEKGTDRFFSGEVHQLFTVSKAANKKDVSPWKTGLIVAGYSTGATHLSKIGDTVSYGIDLRIDFVGKRGLVSHGVYQIGILSEGAKNINLYNPENKDNASDINAPLSRIFLIAGSAYTGQMLMIENPVVFFRKFSSVNNFNDIFMGEEPPAPDDDDFEAGNVGFVDINGLTSTGTIIVNMGHTYLPISELSSMEYSITVGINMEPDLQDAYFPLKPKLAVSLSSLYLTGRFHYASGKATLQRLLSFPQEESINNFYTLASSVGEPISFEVQAS